MPGFFKVLIINLVYWHDVPPCENITNIIHLVTCLMSWAIIRNILVQRRSECFSSVLSIPSFNFFEMTSDKIETFIQTRESKPYMSSRVWYSITPGTQFGGYLTGMICSWVHVLCWHEEGVGELNMSWHEKWTWSRCGSVWTAATNATTGDDNNGRQDQRVSHIQGMERVPDIKRTICNSSS